MDLQTQQAIREQTDRDVRIQKQTEREEAARFERLQKQKEYNGKLLSLHEQNHLPVAFELVLESDPRSGDIVIEVDLMLVQYMKEHQGEEKHVVMKKCSIYFVSVFFSRRRSFFVESSFRIDTTHCCEYRSSQ